jgi:hypothetical protein
MYEMGGWGYPARIWIISSNDSIGDLIAPFSGCEEPDWVSASFTISLPPMEVASR